MRPLYLVARIIVESISIAYSLLWGIDRELDFILIQNPPSIPSLIIIYLVCKLKGIQMIVDFHNYGFTILELTMKNRIIIKIAKQIEIVFSRLCDYGLCVSKGMQTDLLQQYQIRTEVVYDRANSEVFRRLDYEERQEVLSRLGIIKKGDNKLVIVSGTSWTPDEDFGVLLQTMI